MALAVSLLLGRFHNSGPVRSQRKLWPNRERETIPAVIAFISEAFVLASVLFLGRGRRVTVNA